MKESVCMGVGASTCVCVIVLESGRKNGRLVNREKECEKDILKKR